MPPTPFPAPPMVPPPATMAPAPVPVEAVVAPWAAMPSVTRPGVYQGGRYDELPTAPTDFPTFKIRIRPQGTLYGGETGLPTTANVDSPLELSGSLTGVFLSRGSAERLADRERLSRRWKVTVVLGVTAVILVLVIVALVDIALPALGMLKGIAN